MRWGFCITTSFYVITASNTNNLRFSLKASSGPLLVFCRSAPPKLTVLQKASSLQSR
ncbi:hypothetical protein Pyn_33074 [Prunus yedoensis var. nudiflora]|uniref:Uncharacterized protein n=1 Tax=Prunus yedoensis var. nudiflora TaxID=2094558 RepID=A0A314UR72_PRUYE|nr:hypothetical protein Pyn_33074 [Prunus yedoensis var. nudiflora]